MKKKIISIICVLCLLFALSLNSFADFGDYAGDSDFGDSFDSYDYDDYDYDDDDDDYGGVYVVNGGSSHSGSDSPLAGAIIIAVIIAIIVFSKVKNKKNGKTGNLPAGATPTAVQALNPIESFKNEDPDFSEAELTQKISNLYVKFQNAWQAKDLEPLRPYLTDSFYAMADRQLDAYRKNRQTNMVERIAVLGVTLSGWKTQGEDDVMVARLRTRIVDYVIDDKTRNVVRGSNTAEKFMEYEWLLTRKHGVKTGVNSGMTVQNCPNCGAPVNINKTAKCEYCDCIITVDSTDWAVSEIKGISQRTQ